MAITYKQKCRVCRKNYVEVTRRQRQAICWECDQKSMQGEIKDPKLKRLFNIPEDFYRKSAFLRNIKIAYLRYGSLTDKQVEAFKKTVQRLKDE